TPSPSEPNQILLSLSNSLYFSLETLQLVPGGGETFLFAGVIISYIPDFCSSFLNKLSDCQTPLESLSGFLYLASILEVLGSPLTCRLLTSLAYISMWSCMSETYFDEF